MSKKKGGHGAGHVDESWLIPYADVLTLLLALFIVLFCSSSLDLEKYENIMKAFASEFNTPQNVIDAGIGGGDFLPDDMENLLTLDHQEQNDPAQEEVEVEPDRFGEDTQIGRLNISLSDYIDDNGLGEEMQVKIVGDSLLITLTSDIWFSSGSATISASQRETAIKMSEMIATNQSMEEPLHIVITGHTDNVPMHTAQFPSNWYLSAIRAINFMEVMLDDPRMDPRMFSARGYGEYEPIDDNNTIDGKKRNRRVEVLISIDNAKNDED
ncbi:MAG: OmpA family protein [Clostridiales bacterium]|nr:OmpA family protein [Clostridiales bacterium]